MYNFTDLAIWSTVEIGLALIASSLATLKPLFRKLNMLDTTARGNTSVTAGINKDTARSSTPHSRKRSIMSLGRGAPRDFGEIEEDEQELAVIEKGSRVHLQRVVEEGETPVLRDNMNMKWDEESQHPNGGRVRVQTQSTMYGEW
jgi:hypothetical protein